MSRLGDIEHELFSMDTRAAGIVRLADEVLGHHPPSPDHSTLALIATLAADLRRSAERALDLAEEAGRAEYAAAPEREVHQ